MLAEFVGKIVSLARQAEEVKKVDLPGGKVMIQVPYEAEPMIVDANRQCHHDKVLSFVTLCDWATRPAADVDSPEWKTGARPLVFFVSGEKIVVKANRDVPHDHDSALLTYEVSAAYCALAAWSMQAWTVKRVVTALRTALKGTCTDEYRNIFRAVIFKRRNDGTKSVEHTGESLGREIESQAQSAMGEIPEELVFDVQLFANLPVDSYELRFAVEVDADAEKIGITPVGDCIEDAIRSTRLELVAKLKTEFPGSLVIEAA